MARKAIYKHATQVDASSYPDDGSSPVGTNEWNEAPDPQGMYGNTPATSTITIASGVLTVTDSVTVAAAEAGTSDDLDKLAITNTNEYDLIYLFADTGDTITLKHTGSLSADGQIQTVSGADETLSVTKPTILIRKGNYWYGYGGGTVSDGSVTNTKLADMAANTVKVRDANSSGSPSDKAVADKAAAATADKAALVKINDKFQTFVEGTDGFIKRTLAYNEEDNSWTDLVYWRSLDDAKKASEVMMELPIMGEFMSLVQAESISMQHQEIVL